MTCFLSIFFFFFFNDTATTEIYTLSLHDALPISLVVGVRARHVHAAAQGKAGLDVHFLVALAAVQAREAGRSEEHTSELQSPCNLVCRLLLEKKKKKDERYRYLHLLTQHTPHIHS